MGILWICVYVLVGVVIGYLGCKFLVGKADLRNSENQNFQNLEKKSREDLEIEIEGEILSLLERQEKITNNDIEKLLNVADSTATKYLQRLENKGKIKQIGDTGSGVYYIKI